MTQIVGMVTETSHLFRLSYSLEVPEADGTEGFDDHLFQDKVFYGTDILPNGISTPANTAVGYRVVKQGTPQEIFGGLDPNRPRLSPSQVSVFARHNFEFISTMGGVVVFELEERVIMIRKMNDTGLMLRAPFSKSNQILKPPAGGMRAFFLSP